MKKNEVLNLWVLFKYFISLSIDFYWVLSFNNRNLKLIKIMTGGR